jgi:hypothetical protein
MPQPQTSTQTVTELVCRPSPPERLHTALAEGGLNANTSSDARHSAVTELLPRRLSYEPWNRAASEGGEIALTAGVRYCVRRVGARLRCGARFVLGFSVPEVAVFLRGTRGRLAGGGGGGGGCSIIPKAFGCPATMG